MKFINNLSINAFCDIELDNTFSVFTSIDNILYLIYTNEIKSNTSYDLINNRKISEIKNAYKKIIQI